MSQVLKSGILKKPITCACGCRFKVEETDVIEVELNKLEYFLSLFLVDMATSYVECPECKKKIYICFP